ncbi:MAG: M13 family metallopeptidase [Rikenellaceae bacterium]
MAAVALVACASCATSQSTKSSEQSTGIYLSNLDTTANPGADFYQFACGGWMANNPLTDEYASYGSFDVLTETNKEQIKGLVEELAAKEQPSGTNAQKIGELYKIALDSVRLNEEGYTPIKAELERIAAISSTSEIMPYAAASILSPYFQYYVDADMKESSTNLFQLYQGGTSLGEKEYYLDTDEETTAIRKAYRAHIIKMFELAGFSTEVATENMEAVLEIETRIAKASFSATEQRDPESNYHKMTVEELQALIPTIDWKGYLSALGLENTKELSVSQIEPIQEVAKLLEEVELKKHIAYLQWNLIDSAASSLSDDFSSANFAFYGTVMSGVQVQQPRWKRAISAVNGTLGEAVGQLYVEKYFPAAAKERMLKLVKNLQVALSERIATTEWMSDETKAKAQEKLSAFYVKIGYPDKWKDYSELEINNEDSYWTNLVRASEFSKEDMLAKAGKPVDIDEWGMTPQTVNAYYNPSTNEICFPAAILQYPFFDMEADDAFNYGAIGVVIGHEMTHGFDDQGSQFDKEGNFSNWWTAEDREKFEARTQVMVDFFNKIEVLPGLYANGSLTLGENLADNGGLQVSYQAFLNATKDSPLETVNGFTPTQRFFLAYAGVWGENVREEQLRSQVKSDPHSAARWRVNAALPQVEAWYQAFGITESDSLYVAPESRVSVW